MRKFDSNTEDYITIRCRNYNIGNTTTLNSAYEANATFGQKDAIVRYLETKIENGDVKLNPEIVALVNRMDARAGLIEAYCKALLSWINNINEVNEAKHNLYTDDMFKLALTDRAVRSRLGFWNNSNASKQTKLEAKLVKRLTKMQAEGAEFEAFKQKVKQYLSLEFMQIIMPALQNYSKMVGKNQLQSNLQRVNIGAAFGDLSEMCDLHAPIKVYNVDLVELALYAHILEKLDIYKWGYLFEDRARVESFYRIICGEFLSNYKIVEKNGNECFIVLSLVNENKVAVSERFKNKMKVLRLELGNRDYSQALSAKIKEIERKRKDFLDDRQTNDAEVTIIATAGETDGEVGVVGA